MDRFERNVMVGILSVGAAGILGVILLLIFADSDSKCIKSHTTVTSQYNPSTKSVQPVIWTVCEQYAKH